MVIPVVLVLMSCNRLQAQAAKDDNSRLKRIYFNLYTDSIKTILNYYVNVEGEYRNGRVLPMDAHTITITADHGTVSGVEWVAPKDINFEKVCFRAVANDDSGVNANIVVWLKRAKDPRDEFHSEDMELPVEPNDVRKRGR